MYNPLIFVQFTFSCLIYVFLLSRILTMMHLCIMIYTHWTTLDVTYNIGLIPKYYYVIRFLSDSFINVLVDKNF